MSYVALDVYASTDIGGSCDGTSSGCNTFANVMDGLNHLGGANGDSARAWINNTVKANWGIWETGVLTGTPAAQASWIDGAENTIISWSQTDAFGAIVYAYFFSTVGDWTFAIAPL